VGGWDHTVRGVPGAGRLVAPLRRALDTHGALSACTCLFALACAWAVLHAAGAPVPRVVAWALLPASNVACGLATWRAAGAPGVPPAGRRFWRHMTLAQAFVGVATPMVTAVTFVPFRRHPPVLAEIGVPLLFAGTAIGVFALLRLPVGRRTRGEWVRLTLDGATVVASAAVFLWHFGLRRLVESDGEVAAFLGMLVISVVALLGLVTVVKVLVVGGGPVADGSMWLLASALLIGSVAAAASPLTREPRWAGLLPLSIMSNTVLICWAAYWQRRAPAGPGAPARPRLRPYRFLPYLGVGATSALLTGVSFGHDGSDIRAVAGGSVVVTAIAVARHLFVLRDNDRLLATVREHERRMRHQASHDGLTGLANRARFGELLRGAIAGSGDPAAVAVALVDLDDFKEVNDTLGHLAGDGVLTAVADRLRAAVRAGDVVARLGGDEFAVLLRDAPGEAADRAARRMLALLARPVAAAGHERVVHASIGLAHAAAGDDHDAVLRKADMAMYAAKDRGKDGWAAYAPELSARLQVHAELHGDLTAAIGTDRLSLRYQPIVRLDTGAVVGVEALARFDHPTRGAVAPAEFIPAAEQSGLIVPLGRWVLRAACAQAAAWIRRYGPEAPSFVAVNVAGRQLRDPGFVDDVRAALLSSGLPAGRLLVEVTEAAAGPQAAMASLRALRELGVRVALDDFGTAASSLALLLNCPVTAVKLDRGVVAEVATAGRHAATAAAIGHVARSFGLDALAEGVETADQVRALRAHGYELGQGFLYAGPLAADQLERLLPAPTSSA
jgi:diguanylate cyclase